MPNRSGPLRHRRRLLAHARYLVALAARFRGTLLSSVALFGLGPILFVALYVGPEGERIGYGEAFHHTYFLLFGQPSLPYVDSFALEALNVVIPPLGLAVVVDGILRFGLLAMQRQRDDKEWIAVITKMYEDHVVVCGGGRVGYRVAMQVADLGLDVVVVEKNEDAGFVALLRDRDIPVLIGDIRAGHALERTNIARARAIVCATNDDLANLNVALDARKLNPGIHVVMRLFDDDLAEKMRETLQADAMSTSAVAAPTLALAAIDRRIDHSFRVGEHLMVVSEFVVGAALAGTSVGELQERHGGHALSIRGEHGPAVLHPSPQRNLVVGDVLIVQATFPEYLALRRLAGETQPARTSAAGSRR